MVATVTTSNRYARSGPELLQEIRQPVLAGLSKALRRGFAGVIDELLEQLLREKDWDKRQAIDDALDLMRNGRERIESGFDKACSAAWDQRTRSRDAPAAASGRDEAAPAKARPMLSLIDDNAIGDQLQVSRISGRSRRRMDEEQVDGMRARFGAMLGRDWFADNEYPIAPDVIFEALRLTLAEFGQARTVFFLLEVFEPKLSADLAALYGDLNRRLIAFGVLPEIRYQIAKSVAPQGGGAGSAGRADPAGLPMAGHPGALPAGLPGMAGHPVRQAAGHPGAAQAGQETGQQFGQHFGQQPGGTDPDASAGPTAGFDGQPCFYSSIPPGAPSGAGLATADAGIGAGFAPDPGPIAGSGPIPMNNESIISLAEQIVLGVASAQASATRYLSDPARFQAPAGGEPLIVPTERLLDALTSIQGTVPARIEDVAALFASTREQSSAAAREHGSPLERLIIETVSLIFEQVYDDDELADGIKQQLLRLQVAAFKAALIDPSFFARPDHPMRQLIDRLTEIGADPDFETHSDSPLTRDVAELVGWILVSFERDLSLFTEALARVETIVAAETARRSERLARIAASAERAERHEAARQQIRDSLRADCDPQTPEFIHRFLDDFWSELIARIQDGAAHAPFDENRARRTVNLLRWSIAAKTASDIPKLAAALPQLIADLSRGLAFITIADADRELFFSELLVLHGATIDNAKRQRAPAMAVASAASADPSRLVAMPAAALAAADGPRPVPGRTAEAPGRAADTDAAANADRNPGTGRDDDGDPEPQTAAGDPDEARGADTLPMAAGSGPAAAPDAVEPLRLLNGSEVEIIDADGSVRRFKLGWMSPVRSVFIFSRYPREHRTIRRAALNELIGAGRFRVLTRAPRVGATIDALKAR